MFIFSPSPYLWEWAIVLHDMLIVLYEFGFLLDQE